jgi:hypothetical protein
MRYRGSRVEQMVRQPAFSVVLATLGIVVFCWPMLLASPMRPRVVYSFLFVAWAAVIVALFVMARAGQGRAHGERPGGRPTT